MLIPRRFAPSTARTALSQVMNAFDVQDVKMAARAISQLSEECPETFFVAPALCREPLPQCCNQLKHACVVLQGFRQAQLHHGAGAVSSLAQHLRRIPGRTACCHGLPAQQHSGDPASVLLQCLGVQKLEEGSFIFCVSTKDLTAQDVSEVRWLLEWRCCFNTTLI